MDQLSQTGVPTNLHRLQARALFVTCVVCAIPGVRTLGIDPKQPPSLSDVGVSFCLVAALVTGMFGLREFLRSGGFDKAVRLGHKWSVSGEEWRAFQAGLGSDAEPKTDRTPSWGYLVAGLAFAGWLVAHFVGTDWDWQSKAFVIVIPGAIACLVPGFKMAAAAWRAAEARRLDGETQAAWIDRDGLAFRGRFYEFDGRARKLVAIEVHPDQCIRFNFASYVPDEERRAGWRFEPVVDVPLPPGREELARRWLGPLARLAM